MTNRGFTLIEMLVSTAIFAIVMVIALGALLAMSESDRRAQTINTIANNLNFALDSMSRSIRTGTSFNCGSLNGHDCNLGASSFYFTNSDGQSVAYQLDTTSGTCQQTGTIGCIERSVNNSAWAPITSPEVVITNLTFYLIGSVSGDALQPKLTIAINGYAIGSANKPVNFNLQASVTQRIYDQ